MCGRNNNKVSPSVGGYGLDRRTSKVCHPSKMTPRSVDQKVSLGFPRDHIYVGVRLREVLSVHGRVKTL